MTDSTMVVTLAVIGGTGKEGSGLAVRWASSGYRVIIGSRDAERAKATANELNGLLDEPIISGSDNATAAAAADIVVLTVPFSAHESTLLAIKPVIQGKVLVDVTVPLVPPQVDTVQLPTQGSAAQAAQALLGPDVKVVSAFQNVGAAHLRDMNHMIDCDVLVTGDDETAREQVVQLARAAGFQGWHAGPLANAVVAEGLTSVLIFLNRRHKARAGGIRLTGLPRNL